MGQAQKRAWISGMETCTVGTAMAVLKGFAGAQRETQTQSRFSISRLSHHYRPHDQVFVKGGGGVGWFAIQVQMFRNQASPIRPLRHALRHSPRCATDSIPGRGLPAEDTAALSYVTNSSRRQEPSPWQATTPPVRQTLGPTRPNASLIARSSLLDWGPRRMTCFRSYFSLPGQPWSIASRSACLAAFFFVA